MTYDPGQVTVETTEANLVLLQDTFDAAQYLFAAVEAGAFALDNGADGAAMAAYFRAVLIQARRASPAIA